MKSPMNRSEDWVIIRSIAANIKRSRVDRGLTVKKISQKSGLTEQTIANIETGDATRIDIVKINRLACAMGVPISDILDDVGLFVLQEERGEEGVQNGSQLINQPLAGRSIFKKLGSGLQGIQLAAAEHISRPIHTCEEVSIMPHDFTVDFHVMLCGKNESEESKLLCLNEADYRQVSLGVEHSKVKANIITDGTIGSRHLLSSDKLSLFRWYEVQLSGDRTHFRLWVDKIEVDQCEIKAQSNEPLVGRVSLAYEMLHLSHSAMTANNLHRHFEGHLFRPLIWQGAPTPYQLYDSKRRSSW
jgi:transcriptional regulator with XRE-family HTH domain